MTKIVFSVTNDITYDQRMHRICGSLAEAGFEVLLVGRRRKGSKELSDFNFTTKRLNCYFEKGKLFYLEYNIRLFFFLLFQKADIYSAVDLDTILPHFFCAKLKRKRLVFDAHEYFTEVPEVSDRRFVKKIWSMIGDFCIPKVDLAYTVGPALAQIFSEQYGIPFHVVRNVPKAIDMPMGKKENHPKKVLYQGVLNEGRGLEAAIMAMHRVENAHLYLAGEGDRSSELRALVKREELDHKVTFLGYLLPDDLKRITARADVGLNLLENKGLSYYYSLANKAFDYIQAEVPSIQMSFPEYTALQKAFGCFYLVDGLEPMVIANAVNELLSDTEMYQTIESNCKKAKQNLIWHTEKNALLKKYSALSAPSLPINLLK